MSDQITKVTHKSWTGRLRESLGNVIAGSIVVIISLPVLWFNENKAVKEFKSIKEGRSAVVELSEPTVDPANEGKLVHLTGRATTEERLEMPKFNVSSQALKLESKVEMYQWRENEKRTTKKEPGGGEKTITTYSYQKVWSDRVIDSIFFENRQGHENPNSMPFNSTTIYPKNATVGEFNLTNQLLAKLKSSRKLNAGKDLPELGRKVHAHNQGFYIGENPGNPAVGDVRIFFYETLPRDVSIIAEQVERTFQPYETKTSSIQLLQEGVHNADAMFTAAKNERVLWTWGFRGGGFLLMMIGFAFMLSPLQVVADFVPVIGRLVGNGVGLISAILAFVLSFATIALAWVFYRPLIGGSLLLVAVLALIPILFMRKKQSAASLAAEGPTAEPAVARLVPQGQVPPPLEQVPPPLEQVPPAHPIKDRQFYLYINEETVGPYPEADLRAYLDSGEIAPETLCVPEGDDEWKPVAQCL